MAILTIHRFPLHDSGRWISLGRLAKILGVIPSEALQLFGDLHFEAPFLPITGGDGIEHWSLDDSIKAVALLESTFNTEAAGSLFVPAEWAENVLKAHYEGYTSVTRFPIAWDAAETMDQSDWLTVTHSGALDSEAWIVVGNRN